MTTLPHVVPAAGSLAPDFTLDATSGTPVTLSSFRGVNPVLLAFFPLAFTSVCTEELCSFSDDYDQFTQHQVVVLPISVDSIPTLKEFKAKHGFKTDFLSDFRRIVGESYGVLLPEKFYDNRAYFLIDTSGMIRWAHVEAHPGLKRDDAEIFAEIHKL
jgi:peroxiredoxin